MSRADVISEAMRPLYDHLKENMLLKANVTFSNFMGFFNESDFQKKMLAHVKRSLSGEPESESKCEFILTRGKNIGQPCSKPCHPESDLCSRHIAMMARNAAKEDEEEAPGKCPHILLSGKRKGSACDAKAVKGSKGCSRHKHEFIE